MPPTTDVLGDVVKTVQSFEKNGVPYTYKYDDPSLYMFVAVLAFLILLVAVANGYFKAKS